MSVSLLGILFEVAGAFYLSLAFLFKTILDIKFDVYGTGNSRLLGGFPAADNQFDSQYRQIVEARIGFLLAVLGLLVEAASFLLPTLSLPLCEILAAWLIVFCIAEVFRRILLRPSRVRKIRERRETRNSFWPF